jgi:ribosomal protein S18 acetylase RimI-like enzyme
LTATLAKERLADIRRLGPEDYATGVDTIARLKGPNGYPTPSTEYMGKFLSRPDNVLIVATDDGIPVGYTVAYLLDRVDRDQQMMFFYVIGVAESHRRRGIGR